MIDILQTEKRLEEITIPLVSKGFLKSYDFNTRKKLCVFVYCKNARPPKNEIMKEPEYLVEDIQENFVFDCENNELETLLSIVKSTNISNKLKTAIENYYKNNGFDYVKWNILYANKHSKKVTLHIYRKHWRKIGEMNSKRKKKILKKKI